MALTDRRFPVGRGLSDQQESALRNLGYDQLGEAEYRGDGDPSRGVYRYRRTGTTPSEQASRSRSLRRLQGRGLVVRGCLLRLTPAGWSLFAKLTGEDVPVDLA
jgi:hypothetical protein